MINLARASSAVEPLAAEKTEPSDSREAGLRTDFKWLIARPAPRDRGRSGDSLLALMQADCWNTFADRADALEAAISGSDAAVFSELTNELTLAVRVVVVSL